MRPVLFLVTACIVLGIEGYVKSEDYADYQLGVRYDEYPMIVPKKRTALLVNRLMVALKEAMQNEGREDSVKNSENLNRLTSRSGKKLVLSPEDVRTMDLQRRGHGNLAQQKGRVYWRCYFNAVTCF